jgi:hypothetical protein
MTLFVVQSIGNLIRRDKIKNLSSHHKGDKMIDDTSGLHTDTTINPKYTPADETWRGPGCIRGQYGCSNRSCCPVLNRPTHGTDRSEITSCPGCTNFFVVFSGSNLSVAPDFFIK